MYTCVERESCIACGRCTLKAPAIFDVDENGIAFVKKDQNLGTEPINPHDLVAFKQAYQACPTQAIKRSKTPFSS